MTLDLRPCRDSLHPYETVAVIPAVSAAGDAAVRWCPQCGSIVIDRERNGRIVQRGGVLQERRPEAASTLIKHLPKVIPPKREAHDRNPEEDE